MQQKEYLVLSSRESVENDLISNGQVTPTSCFLFSNIVQLLSSGLR